MNVLYISGTVPDRRYTFIHREVEALKEHGIEVSFLVLKPFSGKSHTVGQHTCYYPALNPIYWILYPLLNVIIYKRSLLFSNELFKILNSIDTSKTNRFRAFLGAVFIESALYRLYKSGIKFSHIHSHHLFAATLFTPCIARLLDSKYSLTLHTLSHYYTPLFLEKCIQNAIFNRGVTKETVRFIKQFKQPDAVYIPNAVAIEAFPQNNKVIKNRISILAIGKLLDKKGFDVLIECCKIIDQRNIEFECSIIGEGPEHANLVGLIKQYHLNDKVKILPFKEFNDLLTDFMHASVLVMPSREPQRSTRDGLPTVILEAMAMKLPVIASDYAGISDVVIHNKTGILIESKQPQAMANAVIQLFENKTLAAEFAENAFNHIKKNYSLNETIQQLSELFKRQNS